MRGLRSMSASSSTRTPRLPQRVDQGVIIAIRCLRHFRSTDGASGLGRPRRTFSRFSSRPARRLTVTPVYCRARLDQQPPVHVGGGERSPAATDSKIHATVSAYKSPFTGRCPPSNRSDRLAVQLPTRRVRLTVDAVHPTPGDPLCPHACSASAALCDSEPRAASLHRLASRCTLARSAGSTILRVLHVHPSRLLTRGPCEVDASFLYIRDRALLFRARSHTMRAMRLPSSSQPAPHFETAALDRAVRCCASASPTVCNSAASTACREGVRWLAKDDILSFEEIPTSSAPR